jgi:hypothetical protein
MEDQALTAEDVEGICARAEDYGNDARLDIQSLVSENRRLSLAVARLSDDDLKTRVSAIGWVATVFVIGGMALITINSAVSNQKSLDLQKQHNREVLETLGKLDEKAARVKEIAEKFAKGD